MRLVHQNFAFAVIASNLIVGGWGLWMWRKRETAPRTFWMALVVAWATIYIQGILGLVLFRRTTPHPPFKHTFYGFLFVVITIAVFPLQSEEPRRRLLVFSAATFFIGIVAVRAFFSCSGCR
jgi:cytochrome bd-type quinol oxidase subunit 1